MEGNINPIAAIKGLEKEVLRIELQGTSSYASVNKWLDEQKMGFDIEIINQLKRIKPNINFYEPKTSKKSRASIRL